MKALLAALAVTAAIGLPVTRPGAAVHATAHPVSTTAPIRTPAELDHYLKTTPADGSPLSLLPPGARKRFLGTLVWGKKGIGGFSYADLQQYLTNAQIRQLLTLFDLQGYAAGLRGRTKPLTAAERNATETPLERQFDQLYFAYADNAHSEKHHASIPPQYGRLLAGHQNSATLARLDDSDVGLLFRAAALASSLDGLRLDLAALHRRGLATSALVAKVHNAFIAARRFGDASDLARQYPEANIAPLPPLHQAANVRDGNPTVLLVNPNGKAMLHKAIDMRVPLRIVVVAGCHFSEDAARAIRADPQLDKLFHEHAIWLANENESLPDVLQWNREFPDQIMNVAWRDNEWPMLDSWAIPTFYVFRHGKLVDQWAGWPADSGMQTLRTHLEKDGILRWPQAKRD